MAPNDEKPDPVAKKKQTKSPRKTAESADDTLRSLPSTLHLLTAKDAGWRSPTLFVLPMTLEPIDPPEPSNRKGRRRGQPGVKSG